jgi:glycosyltransferase involved in cell wall biosynthesis
MKVLLITSFFPPEHNAGTEKRTLGYATELLKLGHNVQVLCAGEWEVGKSNWNGFVDETFQNISVRRINLNWKKGPNPNQYLYSNPTVEDNLYEWLSKWKPDVVHITSCLTLSASVIRAVKNRNIPLVLTLTDFWFICPRLNLLHADGTLCYGQTTTEECLECLLQNSSLYNRVSKLVPKKISTPILISASQQPELNRLRGLRGVALDFEDRRSFLSEMINLVDRVTAPATWLRDVLVNSGYFKEIEVIHSGHDLSWLGNEIETPSPNRKRFGYIGQIIPSKGVDILIDAFAGLNQKGHELYLYGSPAAGSDDYFHELENLTERVNEVKFLGAFPHENLGEVLSEIDVLVVPSIWHENNPRVIQEAFASKTPVIASDVGGIVEFVKHDVNGLLFKRGNSEELARQMRRILEEPGLLEQLVNGIQPVKTIQQEVEEFEEIYTELIQQEIEIDLLN